MVVCERNTAKGVIFNQEALPFFYKYLNSEVEN